MLTKNKYHINKMKFSILVNVVENLKKERLNWRKNMMNCIFMKTVNYFLFYKTFLANKGLEIIKRNAFYWMINAIFIDDVKKGILNGITNVCKEILNTFNILGIKFNINSSRYLLFKHITQT